MIIRAFCVLMIIHAFCVLMIIRAFSVLMIIRAFSVLARHFHASCTAAVTIILVGSGSFATLHLCLSLSLEALGIRPLFQGVTGQVYGVALPRLHHFREESSPAGRPENSSGTRRACVVFGFGVVSAWEVVIVLEYRHRMRRACGAQVRVTGLH